MASPIFGGWENLTRGEINKLTIKETTVLKQVKLIARKSYRRK